MRNQPGISWGFDYHINLFRSSIGGLAVYYDYPSGSGEIIKVFNPKDVVDYFSMLKKLAFYNYNTCVLCPMVKAEIDLTC